MRRYCRRINRADFFNLYAEFITQRKDLTENCVEFVSKLYLPLSSYCCSIVEVNETMLFLTVSLATCLVEVYFFKRRFTYGSIRTGSPDFMA